MIFTVEYYEKNPKTGERGWKIKVKNVEAKDRKEAREKASKLPNFDKIIGICTII